MIVYWSIFLWAFAASSYMNLKREKAIERNANLKTNYKYSFLAVIIALLPLWFFAGFRTYGVGDTILYMEAFQKTSTSFYIPKYSSSFLYDVLRIFIKSNISHSVIVWFFIMDTIAFIPLCAAFSRYSVDIQISLSFFILSGCFEYFFNGARQMIAIAICFYATKFLEKNKIFRYILFVFIASLFHGSAVVAFACILLYRIKPWSRITWLMVFVTITFVFLPKNILANIISDAVENTDYSIYSTQLRTNGLNPIRAITLLVPPVISFILRERIREKNNPMLNFTVNASIITGLMYTLGIFINGLLVARVAMYFMIYNSLFYAYLFRMIIPKEKKIYRFIFFFAYIIFFIYQMYFSYGGLPYISDVLGIYLYW
ncbi:MAG: EpsG family protein [Clostridia bacterium]|nr:EpsG family protein [Clostridia bacterium]